MVAPFNRILVVVVMTILVAIFAWIYARDRLVTVLELAAVLATENT
jgi:hypothetical protein